MCCCNFRVVDALRVEFAGCFRTDFSLLCHGECVRESESARELTGMRWEQDKIKEVSLECCVKAVD